MIDLRKNKPVFYRDFTKATFKVGDMIRPIQIEKYKPLEDFFNGKLKKVRLTKELNYFYAGNQFVYISVRGKLVGLYANAVEKQVNHGV